MKTLLTLMLISALYIIIITFLHVHSMNKYAETEEEKTSFTHELNPKTQFDHLRKNPQSITYSFGMVLIAFGFGMKNIIMVIIGAILLNGTAIWIHVISDYLE